MQCLLAAVCLCALAEATTVYEGGHRVEARLVISWWQAQQHVLTVIAPSNHGAISFRAYAGLAPNTCAAVGTADCTVGSQPIAADTLSVFKLVIHFLMQV